MQKWRRQPPSILLILADDLGWTDTSVQMDPTEPDSKSDFYQTPVLEALAAQGMKFSDAYASSPVCSSTRASVQTGKTPAQLHLTDVIDGGVVGSVRRQSWYHDRPIVPPFPLDYLPMSEITIAEHLKAGNPDYRTSHHQKWHMVLPTEKLPSNGDITGQGYDVANSGFAVFPAGTDPKQNDGATLRAQEFMTEAVALGRPFFTQVSYSSVHLPLEAKQTTIDKYEALPPGVRHNQPLYAAMVEELDTVIGDLLDTLDTLGIADNTYVFVTSDNGGRLANNVTTNVPLLSGKGAIWEGGIRVPLIVRGPTIAAGTTSNVPVALYDLFSTFSDIAGFAGTEPSGVEGTSILPVLEGMATSLSRPNGANGELYFHWPHYMEGNTDGAPTPASAIRDGDFKLVKVYGDPDEIFLFDLSASLTESDDVNSTLNLADSLPTQTASMLAKLEGWLAAVGASIPALAGGDFDGSGFADSADLEVWETNYGKIGAFHSEGDANGDAIINGTDFLAWQQGFGAPPALLSQGNGNGDGTVDGIDLGIWESHYGDVASLSASSAAVPEPTTLALAALCLAMSRRRAF